jgi:hypothetical protein
MTAVAGVVLALGGIPEEGLLVERNQGVNLVYMRVDRDGRRRDPVIAVLAHDVRVELDVGEDVETTMRQGPGIDLGGGIDASSLRTAKDPGKLSAAEFTRH